MNAPAAIRRHGPDPALIELVKAMARAAAIRDAAAASGRSPQNHPGTQP